MAIVSSAAALTALATAAGAAARGEMVRYGPDGRYSGYLVRPEGTGPFPGLVVIHEWWGLNDNIKTETCRLADAGYVALAVDMFGKVTTDPAEARKMVGELDQEAAGRQLVASADYLRSRPRVMPDKVGSIGWCFGGGMSLKLALMDPKLAAAVVYYGQPVTDQGQLAKIKAPILGIFGEADGSIPMNKVHAFDQALTQAGVRHEIHTYSGAGHAFANPTRGDAYKPQAAADAWKKTLAFLGRWLGKTSVMR